MKLWRSLSELVLGAALCSMAVHAQTVKTDYDHSAEFSRYHTFSFGRVQATSPFFEQRFKDDVTQELTKKGWERAQSGGDVVIAAVGASRSQQEYTTFYNGMGGYGWRGWGGGMGTSTTTVQQVPIGTLVVDLYDARSKQLVWRGQARTELSNNSDKNSKKLAKAVQKMFDKFPPKGAQ